ncbi:MAG TPA: Gfo/Idh/MocA family oxidoreductase [Armatimonadetes bacterium]|nr:Gfo/Idh/MocA family oxidoreductase [Armatimonadota bacterium]
MKLNVALIGAGGIAHPHAQALLANEHVASLAIAEPQAEVREAFAQRYGLQRAVADYRELLADPAIDLVDLCLPHDLHCPVALEAFAAGKHVISEKPLARTVEECEAMIEAAEKAGRRLFVSHNQLFFPAVRRAKEMLEAGVLGRPFLALINIIGNEFGRMNDPTHWKGSWDRAGGGVTIDTGIHALYLLEHFFGEVEAVTAVLRRLVVEPDNKADDNAALTLEFKGGVLANIVLTYTALAHPWEERRHLYGTEGSLHLADVEPYLQHTRGTATEVIPVASPPHLHPWSIGQSLNHLLDCLAHDREPLITAEQGRSAVRLAQAAYHSSREGRRVVLRQLGNPHQC